MAIPAKLLLAQTLQPMTHGDFCLLFDWTRSLVSYLHHELER